MNAINSTCKQPVTQLGKGFAAAAIKMLEQSAKPLPVTKKKDSEGRPKKHPAIKGWPLVEIDESFVESQDYSAGICFRADGLQAIDCDITDGSLSESIESYIREKIGDQGRFYYRTADASRPKFLICCRIEGIRQKLVSHKYECGQIEIFAGHKSQFLMAGRHPKGGWYQCEPELGSIPPDQIITLSAEDIYEVIDLFESEAEKRGFEKLTKEGSAQDYKGASGLRSSYGTAQGVFNRMITIDVLISWLEGEGWTVVKEEIFNHQPSYFLKHPTSTNDHSARLYYGAENGNVILYNFSSSVLDGQQKAFSAFELLKVLKFGGDPGKTFRHLEEEYGIENPLSGRDNVNGLVEELENIIGQQVSDDLIQQLADLKLSRDQVKTVLNNHDISFEEAQLTAVSLDSPVPQKTNDLTKVINVGLQNRLIVDQNGEPYLVPEGQNRAIPMDHISDYLLTQVRKNLGMFVRSSVADDAVKHLASIAREEGERVIVAKRTHYDPDTRTIYVDIGDESNTIIVITPDGWTESNCDTPIVFQHGGKKYGALPLPNGQDLEDVTKLFDLIHVDSDSKEVLILASILQTFLGVDLLLSFMVLQEAQKLQRHAS